MWRTVLRLEWRILRRDRAAVWILAVFAVFLIMAAVAGGRHADSLSDGLERALKVEQTRFEQIKSVHAQFVSKAARRSAKDPRDPVWMGKEGGVRLVVLPPAPLAPIAVGQRDLQPQMLRINTGVEVSAQRETETPMSGPTRLSTGAFDPTFLFVVLFPLVVIALSYELLSGERERGTLAMLLSQPVSQGDLVLGKAGARAIGLCLVTLFFAIIGLVVAGAELGTAIAWGQIGLYASILVVWALFWFAVAILVNAKGGSSANNALSLVGLWLVLVIIVPGLLNVVVDVIHPPPSRVELLHEARETAEEVGKELAGLQGRHDIDTKTKSYGQKIVKVQQELARRSAPVHHEWQEKMRARTELVGYLRFLSPAIVVQLALEDVAGSGTVRHQRFDNQVDDFHDRFRAFFFKKVEAGSDMSKADINRIPRLVFEEEAPHQLALRVLTGVFGLFFLTIILVMVARPKLRQIGRLAS